MKEKPESIIITMPVKFLIDLAVSELHQKAESAKQLEQFKRLTTKKGLILSGYRIYLQQMEATIKDEDCYWLHKMNNLPTTDVLYCYVTVLGNILYRANIGGYEPGGHKIFNDGRVCYAKNWMILTHPFVKANPKIPKRGFQGFRYSKFLF